MAEGPWWPEDSIGQVSELLINDTLRGQYWYALVYIVALNGH